MGWSDPEGRQGREDRPKVDRPREEASAVQPPICERCCWPRQEEGPQHAASGQVRVDSCGAVCAFCSSQLVAAAGSLLFYPLVFPTAQQLACVSLLVCGRTTAMLHTLVGVMMIVSVFVINTCATLA